MERIGNSCVHQYKIQQACRRFLLQTLTWYVTSVCDLTTQVTTVSNLFTYKGGIDENSMGIVSELTYIGGSDTQNAGIGYNNVRAINSVTAPLAKHVRIYPTNKNDNNDGNGGISVELYTPCVYAEYFGWRYAKGYNYQWSGLHVNEGAINYDDYDDREKIWMEYPQYSANGLTIWSMPRWSKVWQMSPYAFNAFAEYLQLSAYLSYVFCVTLSLIDTGLARPYILVSTESVTPVTLL